MRWMGHVARIGEEGCIWCENLRERDNLEDPGMDGRMLGRVFRKWDVRVWTGSIWLRIGTDGGHL
jgi:hypothetical protein